MTRRKPNLADWLTGPIPPPTPAVAHAASLYVCESATDATDARLLLDMLVQVVSAMTS